MAWLLIVVAGLLEVAWAVGLKHVGVSRSVPAGVATFAAMLASFAFLAAALRSLPVGTAYAVWTGIGAAGTAALGMAFFGEPATAGRVLCLLLIVAGAAGLRLGGG